MLMRRIFPKSVSAHAGGWDKSAVGSNEVRGKTLGIVGYGNIGSQLAMLAEAIGMRVIFYDHADKLRHGNVEPAETLDELLAKSDIVTLHVPETADTQGMIGEREIAAMKRAPSSSTTRAARSSTCRRWPRPCATSACLAPRSTCFPSSRPPMPRSS